MFIIRILNISMSTKKAINYILKAKIVTLMGCSQNVSKLLLEDLSKTPSYKKIELKENNIQLQ